MRGKKPSENRSNEAEIQRQVRRYCSLLRRGGCLAAIQFLNKLTEANREQIEQAIGRLATLDCEAELGETLLQRMKSKAASVLAQRGTAGLLIGLRSIGRIVAAVVFAVGVVAVLLQALDLVWLTGAGICWLMVEGFVRFSTRRYLPPTVSWRGPFN
ncbi:MAG: hypothetical protein A3J59_02680 [Candidatus Buchananbacteria bacterium RIFCSPHIGHO2_02_FULL_56_16]|uniref:Uncharacterized protein n=1 Tax=Candidatus Buchananbacteria bacterium RIFCSPHIGHO2_02_FULL_56_16 TaxID=1797542 RepID=A0A1G1YG21_9BACT|nr:MAG: hypothetical protein A3J59_02680 [Candidatus Buchananbacteria bacterium RIFCSPHIGHO2_02_FULL_56_16]